MTFCLGFDGTKNADNTTKTPASNQTECARNPLTSMVSHKFRQRLNSPTGINSGKAFRMTKNVDTLNINTTIKDRIISGIGKVRCQSVRGKSFC